MPHDRRLAGGRRRPRVGPLRWIKFCFACSYRTRLRSLTNASLLPPLLINQWYHTHTHTPHAVVPLHACTRTCCNSSSAPKEGSGSPPCPRLPLRTCFFFLFSLHSWFFRRIVSTTAPPSRFPHILKLIIPPPCPNVSFPPPSTPIAPTLVPYCCLLASCPGCCIYPQDIHDDDECPSMHAVSSARQNELFLPRVFFFVFFLDISSFLLTQKKQKKRSRSAMHGMYGSTGCCGLNSATWVSFFVFFFT